MTQQSVSYELVVYDVLPPRLRGGGGKSILNDQLEQIKNGEKVSITQPDGSVIESLWGRPVRIGLYSKGTAATAAKNVLQQRYGRTAAVLGWKFDTRRVPKSEEDDAPTDVGLFATYSPERIVEGALILHEKAEEKRKADLQA